MCDFVCQSKIKAGYGVMSMATYNQYKTLGVLHCVPGLVGRNGNISGHRHGPVLVLGRLLRVGFLRQQTGNFPRIRQ